MLDKQTAYTKWLGIKVQDQPPTLYRLLGVDALESDADAISYAADSRMALLRQFQIGDNAPLAEEILNELSKARVTLLNAEKKLAYDARLRQRMASQATTASWPSTLPRAEAMAAPTRPSQALAASPVLDLDALTSRARLTNPASLGRPKKKSNSIVWVAAAASVALVVVAIVVVNSLPGGDDSSTRDASKTVAVKPETPKAPPHPVALEPSISPKPLGKSPKIKPDHSVAPPVEPPTPTLIPSPTSPPGAVAPSELPPDSEKPTPAPPIEPSKAPVTVAPAPTEPTRTAVPAAGASDAPKKLAPPDADQIKRSEAAINKLYKKELAHPTNDFGQQLLKVAEGTKGDVAGQYVLLRKAIEIGAANDDIETVSSAIDSLEARFELNVVPLWAEALESLSKRLDVNDKIHTAIAKAYEKDDYKSAHSLAELLLASARKAKDSAAIKSATTKLRDIKSAQEEFGSSAEFVGGFSRACGATVGFSKAWLGRSMD